MGVSLGEACSGPDVLPLPVEVGAPNVVHAGESDALFLPAATADVHFVGLRDAGADVPGRLVDEPKHAEDSAGDSNLVAQFVVGVGHHNLLAGEPGRLP